MTKQVERESIPIIPRGCVEEALPLSQRIALWQKKEKERKYDDDNRKKNAYWRFKEKAAYMMFERIASNVTRFDFTELQTYLDTPADEGSPRRDLFVQAVKELQEKKLVVIQGHHIGRESSEQDPFTVGGVFSQAFSSEKPFAPTRRAEVEFAGIILNANRYHPVFEGGVSSITLESQPKVRITKERLVEDSIGMVNSFISASRALHKRETNEHLRKRLFSPQEVAQAIRWVWSK